MSSIPDTDLSFFLETVPDPVCVYLVSSPSTCVSDTEPVSIFLAFKWSDFNSLGEHSVTGLFSHLCKLLSSFFPFQTCCRWKWNLLSLQPSYVHICTESRTKRQRCPWGCLDLQLSSRELFSKVNTQKQNICVQTLDRHTWALT